MKQSHIVCYIVFLLVSGVFYSVKSQPVLKGKIVDTQDTSLPGVSVKVAGAGGTSTDANGEYAIKLANGNYVVTFSYIGYKSETRKITITGVDVVQNITLVSAETQLGEVVVSVGSRSSQRTIIDSPIPIDIIGASDIKSTGQVSFDKALQYRVPSFNTVNTPVQDATSLLDPYEIRNMGPSRTLILINGKRKNLSALTYIQPSPGRGENGADIGAIPTDAIKRVEILRDGASAQYGSDAIAGVMNIILKDKFEYGFATLNSGVTSKGDGHMLGVSINNGSNIGEKGYVNYTLDFQRTAMANRPGTIDVDAEIASYPAANPADIKSFLAQYPDGRNINAAPENSSTKFLINGGFQVGEYSELYYNAAYIYKKVNSFANYRAPYRIGDLYNLLHDSGSPYIGFVPTFEGDLNDYHATVGLRSESNGWKTDMSFITGGNQQLYTVNTTLNPTLGANSPISFKPGGYSFSHHVGNIDVSRRLNEQLHLAFGSEFRVETYEIMAGDQASYTGDGAQSFPGTDPKNAIFANRYNFGGYLDLAYDVTKNFLLNGTARLEQYSDFGNAFVWKLSSRYKLDEDQVVFRSSVSSGFRAPSLQQINLQGVQTTFTNGTLENQGIFNNNSTQVKKLGGAKLKPERSINFTAGIGLNPIPNFSVTLDYYNIRVNDRIILSSNIGAVSPATPASAGLNQVLTANNVTTLNFFVNGIDTRTQGLDFVANYRNVELGPGKLGISLSGNYTLENKVLNVLNPPLIAAADKTVLDQTNSALLLTSRPKYKGIVGFDYRIGKWGITLYNTMFGPTTFHDGDNGLDPNLNTEFKTKVVTDLGASVQLMKNLTFAANIQNLFNVLPKWKFVALNAIGQAILNDQVQVRSQTNALTFNGKYATMTYNGSHFSQLGTTFSASLNLKF